LMIARKTRSDDGSNVIKHFSQLASDRLSSLPHNGRLMINAINHAINVIHHIDTPTGLISSIVMEEFERRGWIGDEMNETKQSTMVFIDVWRRCWNRIVSWKPISSPGQALQDRNLLDLINERDKQRLIECGARYVSLTNEKALLDELRSSLDVPSARPSPRGNDDHQSASPSSKSSSTAISDRARPREDDDDNAQATPNQRSSQADADRTPIINSSPSFSLSRWLSDLGLAQYLETFKSNGFEDHDIEMVSSLTQEDLKEMGITMLVNRKKILAAAAKLNSS